MDEENDVKPNIQEENCIILESDDDESNDDVVFVSETPALVEVSNDDDIIFVSKTEAPVGDTSTCHGKSMPKDSKESSTSDNIQFKGDSPRQAPACSSLPLSHHGCGRYGKRILDLSLSSDSDSDDAVKFQSLLSSSSSSRSSSPDQSSSESSARSSLFHHSRSPSPSQLQFSDVSSSDDSSDAATCLYKTKMPPSDGVSAKFVPATSASQGLFCGTTLISSLLSQPTSNLLTLNSISPSSLTTSSWCGGSLVTVPPLVTSNVSTDLNPPLFISDPMLSSTAVLSASNCLSSSSVATSVSSPLNARLTVSITQPDSCATVTSFGHFDPFQCGTTSSKITSAGGAISSTAAMKVTNTSTTLQLPGSLTVSTPMMATSTMGLSTNCRSVTSLMASVSSISTLTTLDKNKALHKAIMLQRESLKRSISCDPFLSNMKDESLVPIKKRQSVFKKSSNSTSSDGLSGANMAVPNFAPTTLTMTRKVSDSELVGIQKVSGGNHQCTNCKTDVPYEKVSRCLQGHISCGSCLQTSAKLLLAKSKKGSLKCSYQGCESLFSMDQLQRTLPAMVVEILEEKLDQEFIKYSVDLMWEGLVGDEAKKEFSSDEEMTLNGPEQQKNIIDKQDKPLLAGLPEHWEAMEQSTGYKLVLLDSEDVEYLELAIMFHTTMYYPRANITRIYRVQNPVLYQFYYVKKLQMQAENNNQPVLEKQLFHGTSQCVVDGICKTNFDWRRCGVHGTLFGQGSYFARDASYSHMYTDQPVKNRSLAILQHLQSSSNLGITSWSSMDQSNTPGSLNRRVQSQHLLTRLNALVALTSGSGVRWGMVHPPPPPAHTSTPSTSAASCLEKSHHVVFVARVLVGQYTQGRTHLRKPPTLDPSNPFGKCFDSCVDNVTEPKIYVIFDSAQTYPEYIIEYSNEIRPT